MSYVKNIFKIFKRIECLKVVDLYSACVAVNINHLHINLYKIIKKMNT